MNNEFYRKFCDLYRTIIADNRTVLPLCAAENVVSPFSKIPLNSFVQEKYLLGEILHFDQSKNFVGSKNLYPYFQLINQQCTLLFGSAYADPRTLSGVNAVMTLLMSIFEAGDTLLISSEDSGGHGSMPLICNRLGIRHMPIPFNYIERDYDYEQLNRMLQEQPIKGILISPSDLAFMPKLEQLVLPDKCTLIFDATQVLGLIAGRSVPNPLDLFDSYQKVILMGATHKTLPGPTCGLIMTKNLNWAKQFDTKINPDYLRNNHLHHILSLSLVLLEMEYFGAQYASQITHTSEYLGKRLEEKGFSAIKRDGCISQTHQIHLSMPLERANNFLLDCTDLNISLNVRNKKLYNNCGIRIGTQEISRYKWEDTALDEVSDILWSAYKGDVDTYMLRERVQHISRNKTVHYTFNASDYQMLMSLHDSE